MFHEVCNFIYLLHLVWLTLNGSFMRFHSIAELCCTLRTSAVCECRLRMVRVRRAYTPLRQQVLA
jgi:hypothetical protein